MNGTTGTDFRIGVSLQKPQILTNATDATIALFLFGVIIGQKATTAHEHTIITRMAPFYQYAILKFPSFACHPNGRLTSLNRTSMQHSDSGSADFAGHRRDRIASLSPNLSRNGQFQSFVSSQVSYVGFTDTLKNQSQVLDCWPTPRILRHLLTPGIVLYSDELPRRRSPNFA
jgi:hypothetical protein